MNFTIHPIPNENYKGRQWGYIIERDGMARWHVTTGGTGDCWNIEDATDIDDPDIIPLHICELSEFIEALEFLHNSDAHKEHVAHWASP